MRLFSNDIMENPVIITNIEYFLTADRKYIWNRTFLT